MKSTIILLALVVVTSNAAYSQNKWTWKNGDKDYTVTDSSKPVYGPIGTPGVGYRPGARYMATMWGDAGGYLWLFGGLGYDSLGNYGKLNDLWKYSPSTNEWTWVKGNNTINSTGVYSNGTASLNKPGSRYRAVNWVDASGNVWLFGGYGRGNSSTDGWLNDLWKYTPGTNTWTWVKGDNTPDNIGVYGTLGTAAAGNKPGGRMAATSWRDNAGNLYLFGGFGRAVTTTTGRLNEIWKYNIAGNTWTWIKGDNTINSVGVYGTINVASGTNKPGSRNDALSWVDASGNVYLFGGFGKSTTTADGNLNDLWKYTPGTNNWTWIKGDNTLDNGGVYGTMRTASATNKPGGRSQAINWIDASGNFWLYGGSASGYMNDFWKFDPVSNNWTWMNGDTSPDKQGVYGVQGNEGSANHPGSRYSASACKDAAGNFWLMFGIGYGFTYNYEELNELWKYNPVSGNWAWVRHNDVVTSIFPAVYGTRGIAADGNRPGGRYGSSSSMDSGGNCWLFGGYGRGNIATGALNDVWKYAPATNQWAWMKGSISIDTVGVYGSRGVSAASNNPGGRSSTSAWRVGSDGFLWIYGGYGRSGSSTLSYLNDLWKYNTSTSEWTWVRGDNGVDKVGIYGTQTVADAASQPGSRSEAVTWKDAAGNLWLFGGNGFGASTSFANLNDLWKYDPAANTWTWMKGDSLAGGSAVFGIKGTPAAANKPGCRAGAISWVDGSGNFWLFGGYKTSFGSSAYLNDLWKYDPSSNNWTWMNGDNLLNQPAVYGSFGRSSPLTTPGGRCYMSGGLDGTGNFYLGGGIGVNGYLFDQWKYSPATNQWGWIRGDTFPSVSGSYGTINVADTFNQPGARSLSAYWYNGSSALWMFGGKGYPAYSGLGELNDLWKYDLPCPGEIVLNPLSGVMCYPGSAITLTASGGSGSYTWFKDGTVIAGVSVNSYQANAAGTYYVKGTANGCSDIYSNEIIIQPPAVPPGLGGTGIYCLGDPVNIGIPQTEIGQNYTWKQNGISAFGPIGGNGGNQSLQFNMNSAALAGTYIVESTKPGCNSVFSNLVYVGFAAITNLAFTSSCTSQVSFTWDRVVPQNVTQNYEYAVSISSTPPASGTASSSNTQTVSGLSPNTAYYIHVRVGCGFGSNFGDWSSISFTTADAPPAAGTAEWTGAVNNQWTNTANWKCGQVPVSTTAVIINGGKPNYPLVTSNTTVKSLTIKAGASVQVSTGVIITVTAL